MPLRETPGDAPVPDRTDHEATARVAPDEFLSAKKIRGLERRLETALGNIAGDFDYWRKRWEDYYPPEPSVNTGPKPSTELGRLVRAIDRCIRAASRHSVQPGDCTVRVQASPYAGNPEPGRYALTFRYEVGVEVALEVSLDWAYCIAGTALQGCEVRPVAVGEG